MHTYAVFDIELCLSSARDAAACARACADARGRYCRSLLPVAVPPSALLSVYTHAYVLRSATYVRRLAGS